jgi:acetylornithine deacetylase/succinyl-diaminopimelate desuccinylase-like protein
MIEGMVRFQPAAMGLLSPETNQQVLAQLAPDQALMFNAMLRNTISVTRLNAGYKDNVIPGSAEATLDCRLVPGQTDKDMMREIQKIVGPEIELEGIVLSSGAESDIDTPLFEAMVRNLKRYDPEATVVPLLMVGGTDGRFLGARGINYYGYSPIRMPAGLKFMELIHSHDERIPVDAFREGVRVFAETVLDFCS